MMHEMPHTDGLGDTDAICNCCGCSCFSIRMANMFKTPDAIRSNYGAVPDSQKCAACGQCVETCPTNALKLGQRLCAKEEIPVKEVRKVRDHRWSEKDWNKDYRRNREDVAAEGRYMDALELIKKENPFPAVCGRICPHDCENNCTRGEIDEPVAIDDIKRFIADQELKREMRFIPEKHHVYSNKIAVIGSGPAGLSCAYYLAVEGYQVTVFEKEKQSGGMLMLGIPAFRLEKDAVEAEIEILRELGVEFMRCISVFDKNHLFAPKYDESDTVEWGGIHPPLCAAGTGYAEWKRPEGLPGI